MQLFSIPEMYVGVDHASNSHLRQGFGVQA